MSLQIPQNILDAFQCAETHPMRLAVFDVLNNASQVELINATSPKLGDHESHFARGRLAMIKDLNDEFGMLFKAANEAKAGGEDGAPVES